MILNKSYTKKISFLLILSILAINFSFLSVPKKADAYLGVGDTNLIDPETLAFYTVSDGYFTTSQASLAEIAAQTTLTSTAQGPTGTGSLWQTTTNYSVDSAFAAAAKQLATNLIKQFTDATVDWINGGFNGNPAYVADFNKFIAGPGGVVDQTIGDFIQHDPDLNFLCDPFKIQVQLALQLDYTTFRNRITCTLSEAVNNTINAGQNSGISINGGTNVSVANNDVWSTWLTTSLNPQNNPIGAYVIARNELSTKIETAKGTKSTEMSLGEGALTFKRCVDYYVSGTHDLPDGQSDEYTADSGSRPAVPEGKYLSDDSPVCVVKTPGAVISSKLSFLADSAGRVTELQAATANGIDSIIGALITAMINAAIEKVQKGILDNGSSPVQQNYADTLNNALAQIQNTYNNQLTQISTGQITDTSGIINNYYPTDTGTWGIPISTTTTSVIGGPFSAITNAKNVANGVLTSLSSAENTYQNNYLTAQDLLISGRTAFASTSACNLNKNTADSVIRSLLIRANVITNINGVEDQNRNIASIPWNLKTIPVLLDKSKKNVDILNKAATEVASAGSIAAINTAMGPINSTSFNIDTQPALLTNIKTWLRGVQANYNTSFCPVDLTETLQIGSVSSTNVQ